MCACHILSYWKLLAITVINHKLNVISETQGLASAIPSAVDTPPGKCLSSFSSQFRFHFSKGSLSFLLRLV